MLASALTYSHDSDCLSLCTLRSDGNFGEEKIPEAPNNGNGLQ